MNSERAHYENPRAWSAQAQLRDPDEWHRLCHSAALIPARTTSVLDVGTGNGAFLLALEQSRPEIDAMGVERSRTAIRHSVCASPIAAGRCDRLPFGDQAFDTVAALEVVEHLPFGVFEETLVELARVARRHVVLSVPYRENRLRVDCPYCGCAFNPFYHLRTFDDARLRDLIPGFACIRLEPVIVSDVVFWPVLRRAWRWIRARRDFYLPDVACPQCGYVQASARPSAPTDGERPARNSLPPALGRIASWIPRRRRSKWIIGVYERTSGTG